MLARPVAFTKFGEQRVDHGLGLFLIVGIWIQDALGTCVVEGLRHDLEFIFVDDVAGAISDDGFDRNAMCGEQVGNLTDFGDVFAGAVFEPRQGHLGSMRTVPLARKTFWSQKVVV